MTKSTSNNGRPSDPENVTVHNMEDDDYGAWLRLVWDGDDYEDGWISADEDDVQDLEASR